MGGPITNANHMPQTCTNTVYLSIIRRLNNISKMEQFVKSFSSP